MVRQIRPKAADEFKSAYSLGFLGLTQDHSEADLHGALLRDLGRFYPAGEANQQKSQRIHRKTIPLSVDNDQLCLGTDDFRISRNTHNIN